MWDGVIAGLIDESRWPAFALITSLLLVLLSARRFRHAATPARTAEGLLDITFGCLVGVMGFGHLLAVTIHLARGDALRSPTVLLYAIGLVLTVPASWLMVGAVRSAGGAWQASRAPIALNLWLVLALLVSGPHNGPLALPAVLRLIHTAVSRRGLRWALAGMATACYLALLVGSVLFAASGQSFEQFSGME